MNNFLVIGSCKTRKPKKDREAVCLQMSTTVLSVYLLGFAQQRILKWTFLSEQIVNNLGRPIAEFFVLMCRWSKKGK
jgi:hypothetical protein